MKLSKKEQMIIANNKQEYKPIASELARQARWSRANIIRNRKKYNRNDYKNRKYDF